VCVLAHNSIVPEELFVRAWEDRAHKVTAFELPAASDVKSFEENKTSLVWEANGHLTKHLIEFSKTQIPSHGRVENFKEYIIQQDINHDSFLLECSSNHTRTRRLTKKDNRSIATLHYAIFKIHF